MVNRYKILKLASILIATLLMWLPLASQADTYLLMAEEHGCAWCERWNREIAHIYPKTAEGQAAPLVRYDLHGETPANVTLLSRVAFTPTFILVEDGTEVGRIEGYPGEDFFWWLLEKMLRDHTDFEETS